MECTYYYTNILLHKYITTQIYYYTKILLHKYITTQKKKMEDLTVRRLSDFTIERLYTIECVHFSGCRLGSSDLELMLRALARNSCIRQFAISNDTVLKGVPTAGLVAAFELLLRGDTLQAISFSFCPMHPQLQARMVGAWSNSTLRTLELDMMSGVGPLVSAVPGLQDLSMRSCDLREYDLAFLLSFDRCLTRLDLSGTDLSGALGFLAALQHNHTIETLKLCNCQLVRGAGIVLAAVLEQHPRLATLDLSCNYMMSYNRIAQMVGRNTVLVSLDLSRCRLSFRSLLLLSSATPF
jgi:hypothetical protein